MIGCYPLPHFVAPSICYRLYMNLMNKAFCGFSQEDPKLNDPSFPVPVKVNDPLFPLSVKHVFQIGRLRFMNKAL